MTSSPVPTQSARRGPNPAVVALVGTVTVVAVFALIMAGITFIGLAIAFPIAVPAPRPTTSPSERPTPPSPSSSPPSGGPSRLSRSPRSWAPRP